MKKAVHDTLGYLWVKNSVEADKKRQADIAQENGKIAAAMWEKRRYDFGVNWWGTTELGYLGGYVKGYPYELEWFPKDKLIEFMKENPRRSQCSGFWWNPKFGNMEDYFTEDELKLLRRTLWSTLMEGDGNQLYHVPIGKREEYALEISRGILPRTEYSE